jgi:hypothetical protein
MAPNDCYERDLRKEPVPRQTANDPHYKSFVRPRKPSNSEAQNETNLLRKFIGHPCGQSR